MADYTPLGTYNDKDMRQQEDLAAQLKAYQDAWKTASAAGDQAGMDAAHAGAEKLRATQGYSGGVDGSQYLPFGQQQNYSSYYPNGQYNQGTAPGGTAPYQTPYSASGMTYQDFLKTLPQWNDIYNSPNNAIGSTYDQQLSQAINRPEYSYDSKTDPLYNAAFASAADTADWLTRNAMGSVGGYGGSRSDLAAAMTAQQQSSQMAGLIPQYEQIARNRYLENSDLEFKDVDYMRQARNDDYARFRDSVGDTQWSYDIANNRDDAMYNRYRDAVGDYYREDDTAYGRWYQAQRDAVGDSRYTDETNYNRGRDAVSDSRYADETAYNRAQQEAATAYNRSQDFINNALQIASTGGTAAQIARILGISEQEAQIYADYGKQYLALQAKKSASSGSGSSGSNSTSGTGDSILDKMLSFNDDVKAKEYLTSSSGVKTVSERDWYWEEYQKAKASASGGIKFNEESASRLWNTIGKGGKYDADELERLINSDANENAGPNKIVVGIDSKGELWVWLAKEPPNNSTIRTNGITIL